MQRQLDKLNKALDYLQTLLAVAALLCLVVGTYYNSQIYTYLSETPEPETTILTVTASASTMSVSSTCTVHPCNYTVVISERIGIVATLSGNATHIAAQRAAQAAWYLKTQFDNVGTVLLVIYLVLLGFRFVARKYSQSSQGNTKRK